jgi:hypothetical protein
MTGQTGQVNPVSGIYRADHPEAAEKQPCTSTRKHKKKLRHVNPARESRVDVPKSPFISPRGGVQTSIEAAAARS